MRKLQTFIQFTMTETFFTAFTDEFATLLRASRIKTYLFRSIGIATFYLLSLPMVTNVRK